VWLLVYHFGVGYRTKECEDGVLLLTIVEITSDEYKKLLHDEINILHHWKIAGNTQQFNAKI